MAFFAGTLRGNGLVQGHEALAALEEDPQRLNHARARFSESPPSYKSHQSHNSTRSRSPTPPPEEQRRLEEDERQFYLEEERRASFPGSQFDAQKREELRLLVSTAVEDGTCYLGSASSPFSDPYYHGLAEDNIKNRWVEQGIWNNKWDCRHMSRTWKHEEPLEVESESETDTEAEPQFSSSLFEKKPLPKPKRPKSDEERRGIAERRAIREREREASRPFHQFVYQVSKERERIQSETGSGEIIATGTAVADINTRAYENVKNTWVRRGIWNGKWGILPGMFWKHEEPLDLTVDPTPEFIADRIARIYGTAPDETSSHQASGVVDTSQRGLSGNIDSAGLANGNAERSPPVSNPPPRRQGRRVPPPTTGQTARSSRRKSSGRDAQAQLLAGTSLGPANPSKVSKAPAKKRAGPRRQPNASAILETAGTPLRRSRRLQPSESSTAENPGGLASTESLQGVSRSKRKRTATGKVECLP
jgi:hypothetical protein